ncbi:MAG: ComEC/Rec2 family competence protein [Chloroflexota bacterium]
MLRLDVLQAAFGDCLVVAFGDPAAPSYILVDGGPPGTYEAHLRPYLVARRSEGLAALGLVVLTHVDNDHVTGLLDLFADLRAEPNGSASRPLPDVRALWHNSFARSAGSASLEPQLRALFASAGAARAEMQTLDATLTGIAEGNALRVDAELLGVPQNEGFAGQLVAVESSGPIKLDDRTTVRIVGPGKAALDRLRRSWQRWLARHADRVATGELAAATAADESIPNLSSIVFLVERDGARLLMTGDARADHVQEGLTEVGLLTDAGPFHVSVLKVPHHGSARNMTPAFLRAVTADTYVISADGRYGNPDLQCLQWIVEAARETRRAITLAATNETDALRQLRKLYPPAQSGYEIRVLQPDESVMQIPVG